MEAFFCPSDIKSPEIVPLLRLESRIVRTPAVTTVEVGKNETAVPLTSQQIERIDTNFFKQWEKVTNDQRRVTDLAVGTRGP